MALPWTIFIISEKTWQFHELQILDSFKLIVWRVQFVNLKKMEKKKSPKEKKTWGNGENTYYKQFLLFPQYFQKICTIII